MSVCGPHCSGCPWESKGTIFIPSDGSGLNKVLILGDSGWHYEALTTRPSGSLPDSLVGTPFSGPSGWFIE